MIFKHQDWELTMNLSLDRISLLIIENGQTLWKYCSELINQINGEKGGFLLFKTYNNELMIDKLCNIETDLLNFNLNSSKLQKGLIKKLAENAIEPENEVELRKLSSLFFRFCLDVAQNTNYSISIEENIEPASLFKVFSVSFKENFTNLLDKLIEYININVDFTKVKIFFFIFLSKYLSTDEIKLFHKHCEYLGVNLILIEDVLPATDNLNYDALIIDTDNFELTKKS